ncbi:hypoxanthine phosphoribosyltransferase [Coriobacteriia bacterium Es71-Z0120]|uniref:hypoxanthine phosphoribosyltransferase n=1 Tax=Parvivirga hydrogeniphila TaxID=2939460 RepID=UPI002260B335|nr:hypoxanthine phosphoribosyltransferase [Parvivirga hydrogeniphila]MCL4079657.1 hypoxanthine phosphoribosyltransferase [Parvivirga hydrogeniphila]
MSGYYTIHDPLIERVLLTEEEIADICVRLGARITEDYRGKDLVLVSLLRGSLVFLADLSRRVELDVKLDFMAISSYGSAETVRIVKDLDEDVSGKHVLVVEDIVDTGLTLHYLLGVLAGRSPASLAVCTLLDRRARRIADVPIVYRGIEIPDVFVVGYGIDLGGRYRNLPYVAVVREEVMG